MKQCEYEVKMLLSRKQYEQTIQLLDKITYRETFQTNYYYDTNDQMLRKQNTTMRIRRKENRLKGTLKQHIEKDCCSIESNFQVSSVPETMLYNDEILRMMGKLYTVRREFLLSDSVRIFLDKNEYLNCVDYELEIECPKEILDYAKGMVFIIREILRISTDIEKISKSERFFRRLNLINKAVM